MIRIHFKKGLTKYKLTVEKLLFIRYNKRRIGGRNMEKKETNKKNYHNIEIKVEGKEWTDAIDKAFKEKVKKVEVDGFRKGKCPKNIYDKKFGQDYLIDAADLALQDAYIKALKDNDLVPVVQPEPNLKSLDEKSVTFTFKIITKPEVKIKKYRDLGIKPNEVKVTKEEIDHEISHLLERFEELVNKSDDAKVEEGDIAIIDFEGFKDGEPFDGGKGENYSLEIGSGTFIPGFEEQLIGMKSGDEKDIKVTFPEDYMEESLKGKEVTFKVKVHEIKTKEKRELDEDFFFDLGIEGVNDEDSLRKEVEANIKANKDMEEENNYIDRLLEAVSKNVEVDIPEEMVNEEVERLFRRTEQQMAMQGISLDLYYQVTKSTEKDLKDQLEKEAYQNVLYRLMLEEIMNMEHIEVSESDAMEEAKKLSERYNMELDNFLNEEKKGGKTYGKEIRT